MRVKSTLAIRWVPRSASDVSWLMRLFDSWCVDSTMARWSCKSGLSVSSFPRRTRFQCLSVIYVEKLLVSDSTTRVSTGAFFSNVRRRDHFGHLTYSSFSPQVNVKLERVLVFFKRMYRCILQRFLQSKGVTRGRLCFS